MELLVTCFKCFKELEIACSCYEPREKLKIRKELFEKQLQVIELTQFEKKLVYIKIEESNVIKKCRIKKNNLFSITCYVKFNKNDYPDGEYFTLVLLDWDKNPILKRKEKTPKFSFFKKSEMLGWTLAAWSG